MHDVGNDGRSRMNHNEAKTLSLFSDSGIGPVQLMFYLLLSVILMLFDGQGQYLRGVHGWLGGMRQPLYQMVTAPLQWASEVQVWFAGMDKLRTTNKALEDELVVTRARLIRMDGLRQENNELRRLMRGNQARYLQANLADIKAVDFDPYRHRVVLNIGEQAGIKSGLGVMDADGVFGQITQVHSGTAECMLISDPGHALPVRVVRTGLRTVAIGTGQSDELTLPTIPHSADVQVGDVLETSGLGGRFMSGLPVGTITALNTDAAGMFQVATAKPSARLSTSKRVLVLELAQPDGDFMGPPTSLSTMPQTPSVEPTETESTETEPANTTVSPSTTSSSEGMP